ncbi:hypothetical protein [Weeksella virosa]|nr:hypothetical protein [Weeksella virosa]
MKYKNTKKLTIHLTDFILDAIKKKEKYLIEELGKEILFFCTFRP